MPKTYTLKWKNPVGNQWETLAENLNSAREVFVTIEKVQKMWKIPDDHLEKFYQSLKIIEISGEIEKEISVDSLMPS